MTKVQASTATKRTGKKTVRESQGAYVTATGNKERAPRKPRSPQLVVETYRGKPYEYYPLGKFLVAAPGICDGQPSFKYTRVPAKRALNLLANGATLEEVAQTLANPLIPAEAVREAVELARKAFVKAHPALRRLKKWSL